MRPYMYRVAGELPDEGQATTAAYLIEKRIHESPDMFFVKSSVTHVQLTLFLVTYKSRWRVRRRLELPRQFTVKEER